MFSGYICAAVITSGGYAYFGSVFVCCFLLRSLASFTACHNVGAVLMRIEYGSKLVTNDVCTTAPFSYFMSTPTLKAVQKSEYRTNPDSVGANKKNFTPLST